ncbi:hypothetical protein EXS65_03990 [Candidatus Peribacteria bacterium]|nr:hypothetical protein [Candidatus Peribacteria bacterium]
MTSRADESPIDLSGLGLEELANADDPTAQPSVSHPLVLQCIQILKSGSTAEECETALSKFDPRVVTEARSHMQKEDTQAQLGAMLRSGVLLPKATELPKFL